MKVLVAGGTGAIGRPLVRRLEEAGHEPVAVGRSSEPVAMDALDPGSVRAAVATVRPDVIVNQLTAIPDPINPRKMAEEFEPTNRLRREGTANLMSAAKEHGVGRVIAQSVAFAYAPTDGPLWSEDDRLWTEAGEIMRALQSLEEQTLGTDGVEGVVLRYGFFYGPGTTYAASGGTAHAIRKRQFPVIGNGAGVWSMIHVDDAAAATVLALDRGAPGIYNVVDDDPTPLRELLPGLAEALGAKRPRRVPKLVGRLAAGPQVVHYATSLQGASNGKAKRELGWRPRYPSWRQGVSEALG